MSLFNEQFFWEELREHSDPKKRNIILKYEAMFGSLNDMDIQQTRFYKNYLSKFDVPFRVNVPEDLTDDFDWDLLMRLIAGSYSSEMTLHVNPKWLEKPKDEILVDVYIEVKSEGQKIEKKLDELWSFQILRLYEIYIEEQMNMLVAAYDHEDNGDEDDEVECDISQILPVTDDEDNDADECLGEERMIRTQRFKKQIESVYQEIEKDRADKKSKKENETLDLLLDEQNQDAPNTRGQDSMVSKIDSHTTFNGLQRTINFFDNPDEQSSQSEPSIETDSLIEELKKQDNPSGTQEKPNKDTKLNLCDELRILKDMLDYLEQMGGTGFSSEKSIKTNNDDDED